VPAQNSLTDWSGVPTQTPVSQALSKDLRVDDFNFIGPIIVYALIPVVGCVPFFLNRAMTFIAARALPAKVPSDGLPAQLYHRRRELRLTKVEVAKVLGVTPGIIRRWEEAEHPPSAKHVPAIVEFLGDDDWLEAGSFCQRLARFRKLRGWSQLQLSQSLNCAESSVRMWERGVRPSRSMRSRIEGHIGA
jgi:transcriptional regulator with XRE-family HTH domain